MYVSLAGLCVRYAFLPTFFGGGSVRVAVGKEGLRYCLQKKHKSIN